MHRRCMPRLQHFVRNPNRHQVLLPPHLFHDPSVQPDYVAPPPKKPTIAQLQKVLGQEKATAANKLRTANMQRKALSSMLRGLLHKVRHPEPRPPAHALALALALASPDALALALALA